MNQSLYARLFPYAASSRNRSRSGKVSAPSHHCMNGGEKNCDSYYIGGVPMTRSEEALKDILEIGAGADCAESRLAKARARVEKYKADSAEFHTGMSDDVPGRVRSDLGTLSETIHREMARRSRAPMNDSATDLLTSCHKSSVRQSIQATQCAHRGKSLKTLAVLRPAYRRSPVTV